MEKEKKISFPSFKQNQKHAYLKKKKIIES